MLKVEKQVSPTVRLVVEGENHADVFGKLASSQEVFGEKQCGKCKEQDLRFQVRQASKGKKQFSYYEMVCNNPKCRAKLAYGQSDDGVLFPVRWERHENEEGVHVYTKDDNGRNIPKGAYGWTKYNPDTGKEE